MHYFALFIRRDSVSPFKFSLLGHIHANLPAISLVCRLKCPYSCFSSYLFSRFFDYFSVCPLVISVDTRVGQNFLRLTNIFTWNKISSIGVEVLGYHWPKSFQQQIRGHQMNFSAIDLLSPILSCYYWWL